MARSAARSELYRRFSKECLEMARATDDARVRAVLIQMAQGQSLFDAGISRSSASTTVRILAAPGPALLAGWGVRGAASGGPPSRPCHAV